MRVPLLDLGGQLKPIREDIRRAIDEVVDSTRYVMGPRVEEFERAIAEYCGVAHAVGVSSGTDALLAALMALDIGAGDIVITTPYSFFASTGVIARLGATPAFVDIDADTYNMSPAALGSWFETHRDDIPRVKAILPIHLYGQCADMDAITAIAREHDKYVVEDAAQAIGATYPSAAGVRRAGSMGTLGCFSFFPSKNLGAIGDGGMVVTSDERLAEKLRRLRNHGMHPKYHHDMIGGNFSLDALQAAVLSVKLPHLESWHAGRRENATFYDAHLKCAGVTTPAIAYERENHIYNQYIISIADGRDDLREALTAAEIGHDVYYPVALHEQPCFQYLGYSRGDFPNSEYAADHTLALPIYAELSEAMLGHVCATIASALNAV